MKVSFRAKLLGTYLLLLLVMGGVLFLYLDRTLERQLVDGIRNQLRSQAGLAALTGRRELLDPRQDAPPLAAAIGARIHARVTLLDDRGAVIGDSEIPPEELSRLENHRDRPEIRAALATGEGSAIRYSSTLRENMLYVAVRLLPEQGDGGVLRLALPLREVSAARSSLRQSLALAFALAALLAGGLSLLLSQVFTRSLRVVSAGAERFSAGDLRRRIPVAGDDEFGQLARVLNVMAERLQLQMERLADERNRLDAILRGMGEGVLVAGRDGTVQLTNPAFCTQFGVGEDALGRPLIELSRHPLLHEHFRATLASRKTLVAELALGGDGETILLAHWTPLLEAGVASGVVAVFHDISDLKRLERVRRDFVANVSHELRTPVAVIGGYAETLAGGVVERDPATALRFAAIIRTHAARLTALIGDLLTLSRLESGSFPLNLAPVAVDGIVQRCCALLETKGDERGVSFACPAATSLWIEADPQRLEQIMVNLLDNAVKYSPSGGVVRVLVRDEGERVAIAVSDQGAGIPAESLSRIFERFYRVDAARSREEGGTGLGLAIVKHLVQLHGGSVTVASPPGEGAIFTVKLRKLIDTAAALEDTSAP